MGLQRYNSFAKMQKKTAPISKVGIITESSVSSRTCHKVLQRTAELILIIELLIIMVIVGIRNHIHVEAHLGHAVRRNITPETHGVLYQTHVFIAVVLYGNIQTKP